LVKEHENKAGEELARRNQQSWEKLIFSSGRHLSVIVKAQQYVF